MTDVLRSNRNIINVTTFPTYSEALSEALSALEDFGGENMTIYEHDEWQVWQEECPQRYQSPATQIILKSDMWHAIPTPIATAFICCNREVVDGANIDIDRIASILPEFWREHFDRARKIVVRHEWTIFVMRLPDHPLYVHYERLN